MTLIYDVQQFNYFVDTILPPLKEDEVYFLSLSARKKYLTDEEKEFYQLGRTEMYGRQVARSKEQYIYAMRKLEAIFEKRLTKSGKSMPEKANVVYANINPSSTLKAYLMFQKEMNTELGNVVSGSVFSKTNPSLKGFKYIDRKLMNCLQKCSGTRHYVDIDIDTNYKDYYKNLTLPLSEHSIKFFVIETKGGYHVLINREDLNKSNFQLHKIIKSLHNDVQALGSEVVFNKKAMIPVPGTLQSNFLVSVKESNIV